MLHYISLPVRDLAAAKAFYAAALAAPGYRLVAEAGGFAGFGLIDGEDMLALTGNPRARATGPGFHLAFTAPSPAAVDRLHAEALPHGAKDKGAPGLWPHHGPTCYAAFVADHDGHRLEAVHK